MSDVVNQYGKTPPCFVGLSEERLSKSPGFLDILDSMNNADTTTFIYTETAGTDRRVPPSRIQVYRHTGGDITNSSPAATYTNSTGDTLTFAIDDGAGNNRPDGVPFSGAVIPQYTHSLVGLTAANATAVQIAASINGDKNINTKIRAAAGLTSNAVTIAPIGPLGSVQVVGASASAGIAFAATVADAKKRTYVSQSLVIAGGTGFSWSYNAGTRTLIVTNSTGGAVNRVVILFE